MELDIVFAHELLVLHLLVLPPIAPVVGLVRSNTNLANGCIKPHLEYFVFKSFNWDWSAPFKVTSDATLFKAYFQECLG